MSVKRLLAVIDINCIVCFVNNIVTITALRVLTRVDSEYHPIQSRGGFPGAGQSNPILYKVGQEMYSGQYYTRLVVLKEWE